MGKKIKRNANGEKMTTIKHKIRSMIIVLVVCSLVVVGSLSCWLNYNSTVNSLQDSLTATAQVAAGQVEYRLEATKNIVETIGTIARLSKTGDDASVASKMEILERYQDYYGWTAAGIFDTTGAKLGDSDTNVSDRTYFEAAMAGLTTASDPVYSKDTGELICTVAAPLWAEGTRDTEIVGVVVVCLDASTLSDVVSNISISENGYAFIVNNVGAIIAHPNYDLVTEGTNYVKQAETDTSVQKLGGIISNMMEGETGFGTYRYGGQSKYIAYAPINGTAGWSVGVSAPISDFMGSTYMSIGMIAAVLVLASLISAFAAARMASSVGTPIQKCAERLEKLAQGDFQSEVPQINTRDETKKLAQSTEMMVNSLKLVISDIDYLMSGMADGNLGIRSKIGAEAYVGDLQTIFLSMRTMNRTVANTLAEISTASDQVASGAEQLASSATSLSQGATEQAASVEELAATISEISAQTEENARHAAGAEQDVKVLGENIKRSDEQMQQLIVAMQDINNASAEIKKIIKTIEDIAFQTNILALNAAVEAARAGAAGKGFAVVAEEVRNLAGKSGEAANSTTALIEQAIRAVEDGSRLVDETGVSLNSVVGQAKDVVDIMGKIIHATEQQAESVNQVTLGIDQISNVVQTNSSAAEESAATSQELSSQAEILKSQVSTFKF